ncbi:MAG: hypothetical protein K8R73_12780 [Clostridiales bacterium]|nr:hypothetical protein [Clostridiales bacterium]
MKRIRSDILIYMISRDYINGLDISLIIYRKEMQLSKEFIEYCKSKIGKSRRYLVSDAKNDNFYNSEWELMVPEGLFEITDQGGDILV